MPALQSGKAAGLDKRTAERLRRGQIPVEARIDLHGLTQDEAHRALTSFVTGARRANRRCVLVITGKGARAGETGSGAGWGSGEVRGVLRQAVPRWLNEPPLRPIILGFAQAQPADGGVGALYVLLKRQR